MSPDNGSISSRRQIICYSTTTNKKKAKRKRGGNHNAIRAVRKSIFERLEHMYTLCYYLYRKQFDYEPRKSDPSFLFVEKFSWSSKWSWPSSVIGWLQGRRKVWKSEGGAGSTVVGIVPLLVEKGLSDLSKFVGVWPPRHHQLRHP